MVAVMRFALRRRVDGLTADEIDEEISRHQKRAEHLVHDLSDTLQRQAELLKHVREDRQRDDPSGQR